MTLPTIKYSEASRLPDGYQPMQITQEQVINMPWYTNTGPILFVDVEKAEEIISALTLQGKHIDQAHLGLDGDFEDTVDIAYDGMGFDGFKGQICSYWAIPTLVVYFANGLDSQAYRCYYVLNDEDLEQEGLPQ